MVMGAPLEDARLLTQRYERLRQEAENQVYCFSLSGLWPLTHNLVSQSAD